MELVGTKATHWDILMSPTHNVEFAVRQKEKITDMVLYCVREPEFNNDKAKLCGLQMWDIDCIGGCGSGACRIGFSESLMLCFCSVSALEVSQPCKNECHKVKLIFTTRLCE